MICAIRNIRGSLVLALAFGLPGFAKCPVADGTTVIVRAAIGDLHVDTTGREASVDVQVDNKAVQVQENCGKDVVQFTGNAPDQIRVGAVWKIVAPKNVHLDLVTMAGNV